MAYGITCCRYCVPPKRHRACHDTCKEYKEQKEDYKKQKEQAEKLMHPKVSYYDFSKIGYADYNSRKRRREKNR